MQLASAAVDADIVNNVAKAQGAANAAREGQLVAGAGTESSILSNAVLDETQVGYGPEYLPSVDDFINLANDQRTQHILLGNATAGGHLWPIAPGKTPFPDSWNVDKIMHSVSDLVRILMCHGLN